MPNYETLKLEPGKASFPMEFAQIDQMCGLYRIMGQDVGLMFEALVLVGLMAAPVGPQAIEVGGQTWVRGE